MRSPPIPVFPLHCWQDREAFVKSTMGAHKLHRPVRTKSEHISQGTWKTLSSFPQDTSFTILPDPYTINQRVCCSQIAQEMRSRRKDFPKNHGGRLKLSENSPEVLGWFRSLVSLLAGLAVLTKKHGGCLPLEPYKNHSIPLTNPPLFLPIFFLPCTSEITNHIFWPVNQEIYSNMGKGLKVLSWNILQVQCNAYTIPESWKDEDKNRSLTASRKP